MTTKRRYIFYADTEIEQWLKEQQILTGASVGEIVRRAILCKKGLDNYPKKTSVTPVLFSPQNRETR
jgi:hypothetical protein